MITYEQALDVLLSQTVPADPARLPLADCLGLTLAGSVTADRDCPPFDRAMMDGYAVRSADVAAAPVELAVLGDQPAGAAPTLVVGPGQAVGISTGAPLPEGADAVVRVENTESAGECRIRVRVAAAAGANVAAAGVDAIRGQTVLAPGTLLTPARLAAAAAVGAAQLWVYPAPRVGLLATGDELVHHTLSPGVAQVRDSTGPMLEAALRRMGVAAIERGGLCRDVEADIRGRLAGLLERNDVVLVTGGVSVGGHDHVPGVVAGLGGQVRFHRVAIKPGGPVLFATADRSGPGTVGAATDPDPRRPRRRYVLALPGNPVSSSVGWLMLGSVLVGRLMGRGQVRPPRILAMCGREVGPAPGRMTLVPARLRPDDKFAGWRVEPVEEYTGSADVFGLARANALIVRPAGADRLARGAVCEVVSLETMMGGLM
ncbi:MAG: Molybdopterin molybdenumtransferase [Phycisphaerae bacterium]|nr:Molybdopterin molybdenumtransferase [Phycisphaerae bacterium]